MFHLKAKSATPNHAQLTAKYLTGANGPNALFHAEEEDKQELEKFSKTQLSEELNAQPNKKPKFATSTHALLIVSCLNGDHLDLAARNAVVEFNLELELLPLPLNSEELLVVQQLNPVNATLKTAQLTASWPHGDHGQNVIRLVEVVLLKEPELSKDHQPTEVFHVVQPLNVNNATQPHAQLTALWELGLHGVNAANHVDQEFKPEQEAL